MLVSVFSLFICGSLTPEDTRRLATSVLTSDQIAKPGFFRAVPHPDHINLFARINQIGRAHV